MTSDEFANALLKDQKVAVVPGTAFGACGEGFLRISYAYSLDSLKTALDRIENFVIKLREQEKAKLNIVLYEPEIPSNTGNIGRTCVATGTRLHLIEPLGFRLNEKAIKRAGMDYWSDLDVTTYVNYEEFLEKNPGAKIYMATTKSRQTYTEVSYEPDCYIMFGKESAGIPEEILVKHPDTCVRIPMIGETRSLNLSNSVAIVLYEALRQNNFDHMKLEGDLHRLHWD